MDSLSAELQFDYTGADQGSFTVAATWPFDPDSAGMMGTSAFHRNHPTWAVAYPFRGSTVVVAQLRRPDGWFDIFEVVVPGAPGAGPRTETIGGYAGEFVIGTGGGGPLAYYFIKSGSVTVSEVSGNRLKGTFVLQMMDADTETQLVQAQGSFDVPVLAASPYS